MISMASPPPHKFSKSLIKCKLPKIHEPQDLISGDGIKNFER
jgi:hypothetical protein